MESFRDMQPVNVVFAFSIRDPWVTLGGIGQAERSNDDNDEYDDDGYPAHSPQPYSHQVGICHNEEGVNMTPLYIDV